MHFGKKDGDYVYWDSVMVEGQISFSLMFIDKYLALVSKCSCINHAEPKEGWKFPRCMINLRLNSICFSPSKRKVLKAEHGLLDLD